MNTPRLEQTVDVETPEMVVVSYTVAGPGSRLAAALFDFLICVAIASLIALAGTFAVAAFPSAMGKAMAAWVGAILLLVQFATVWGYYVLFEGLRDGQTPGKKRLGLRVVREGGYSIDFAASATRNIVRVLDMQPFFIPLVGMASMSLSRSSRRIGDMVAGTIVVKEQISKARAVSVPSGGSGSAPASVLGEAELDLLRRYMERRHALTPALRAATASNLARMFRGRIIDEPESDAAFLVRLLEAETAARSRGAVTRGSGSAGRERNTIISEGTPRWNRFADAVTNAQRGGIENMSEDGVRDFVASYREVSADLARLRTASRDTDSGDVFYLSRLVAAGHNLLYRGLEIRTRGIVDFVIGAMPQEVIRSWRPVVFAGCLLLLPGLATHWAVVRSPSLAHQLVGPEMIERAASGVERGRAGTGYIQDPGAARPLMGSFIIANNISVSFYAFALGVTGLGTAFIVVTNSISLGAVSGLYASHGIGRLLLAFVAPHGVLELSAITLAAAAGFLLSSAILLPGAITRREALVANGKRAMRLVAVAILFLVVAGAIEGLVSPIPWWSLRAKLLVSAATLVAMVAYLGIGFRTPPGIRALRDS